MVKTCVGCGQQFEAMKASRKWCSDTCGKRTRRRAGRGAASVPVPPVAAPSYPASYPDGDADGFDGETLQHNLAFARFVAPGLALGLSDLAALADPDDPGWVNGCENEDWDLVAAVLIDRLVAALHRARADLSANEPLTEATDHMHWLQGLVGDEFSNRIIGRLAEWLRDADTSLT